MSKKNLSLLQYGLLIILLALLVVIILVQANPMVAYPSRDGGFYTYIGSLILKGKLLYIDAWEGKPPGIFYLNALGLWLGQGTRWGIWLLEFVFLFGAALTGFNLMRKLWNNGAALFGTVIWLIGFNSVLGGGNYTEEYPLLFNFIAIYIFWKSLRSPQKRVYDFIFGLTLALSFLFRANNIGVQISIALTMLIVAVHKKEIKLFLGKMVIWGMAGLLVLGAVCIYFWTRHALGAMIEAAILYNFSYGGAQTDIGAGLHSGFLRLGYPAWIALAGYLLALYILVRRYVKDHTIDEITLFLAIGWPLELVLSSLSGRGYGHYFISWLPVMALMIGLLFYYVAPLLFTTELLKLFNERLYCVMPVLIGLVIYFFRGDLRTSINSFERVLFDRSTGVQLIEPIADYIRDNTDPDDTVLVWGGEAGINFMAHRDSPVPQLYYPLYVDSPFTQRLVDSFLHDINQNKPELIVAADIPNPSDIPPIGVPLRDDQVSHDYWISRETAKLDQFFVFFDANYTVETVVGEYMVYRLNGVNE